METISYFKGWSIKVRGDKAALFPASSAEPHKLLLAMSIYQMCNNHFRWTWTTIDASLAGLQPIMLTPKFHEFALESLDGLSQSRRPHTP